MAPQGNQINQGERIAILETDMTNLKEGMSEIKKTLSEQNVEMKANTRMINRAIGAVGLILGVIELVSLFKK